MNNFEKFNKIRKGVDRKSDVITNVSEVSSESGFRCLHILWLYADVMNIHGGRGDVMGMLHISNLLGIPVEIRRADNLREEIDWEWPHIVFMTAGELKCAADVVSALNRQKEGIDAFIARKGYFIANGSSGAVLAKTVEIFDGTTFSGLGLLDMKWKERDSVWGDDIWVKTVDGLDVIGNQIQVADVTLADGQEAFGSLTYGRGNDGKGEEGARTGNIIYTGVLGPLLTKNPEFTASFLKQAAKDADIKPAGGLTDSNIEIELKSAEYIKNFMKEKMAKA